MTTVAKNSFAHGAKGMLGNTVYFRELYGELPRSSSTTIRTTRYTGEWSLISGTHPKSVEKLMNPIAYLGVIDLNPCMR